MKIAQINRTTLLTMVLLAGIVINNSALGQLNPAFNSTTNLSEFKVNNQQSAQMPAISSKSFQQSLMYSNNSELKQHESLIQNGIKLDSIEEYNFTGWQSKRFKYYFNYENGALKSKRCVHFGKSYSDSLGITEEWTYNNLQQLERYEKLKKLTNWNDTIITDEENIYEYLDDTLIVKSITILTHFFYTNSGYNNVKYEAGYALYNNYQERYTYNEKGQLTAFEGGERYEKLHYEYDDFGNLIYRYRLPNYVENYNYGYANRSIDITYSFFHFTGEAVPFDSITDWIEIEYWHFDMDQFSRDSICKHYSNYRGISTSLFEYDTNGNLSYISISFRDEVDTTKWMQQGRLQYSYNSNQQLASFQQSYFDENWNQWNLQNSKEYFYSEVKSAELEPAPDTVSGNLKIYPNPSNSIIHIEGVSCINANYFIYDLFGCQMLSGNLANPVIDISKLKSGVYMLKLINGNSTQVLRFVKK